MKEGPLSERQDAWKKLQEGDKVKFERKVKLEKQMSEQEIIQGEAVNFEKIIEQ